MGNGPGMAGTIPNSRVGAVIFVKILDENKKPLKQQALIRITNQSTGAVFFQTTSAAEAKFLDLPPSKYLLEVGAAGYFAVHEQIAISDVSFDAKETVSLTRDPSAVDLKLKDPGQLPSKVRKEAEKGVLALELSNFVEARKHLEAANHLDPSSSSINFLLGYLSLQQKDQEHALSYLTTATKLDPGNIQAQNLLGQIYLQRGDYVHAEEAAQIVVASQGQSLTARKVLAASSLRLKQFEKARENAQWIVDQGGSDAVQARLILGQALAGLHKNDEAIQTLTTYLAEEPCEHGGYASPATDYPAQRKRIAGRRPSHHSSSRSRTHRRQRAVRRNGRHTARHRCPEAIGSGRGAVSRQHSTNHREPVHAAGR